MKSKSEILTDDFTLWMGRMRTSGQTLWLWTQSGKPVKTGNSTPAYFIEHPIYMTEFHECTQKTSTLIDADEVLLIRPADYDDYEQHLIIDVAKECSHLYSTLLTYDEIIKLEAMLEQLDTQKRHGLYMILEQQFTKQNNSLQ